MKKLLFILSICVAVGVSGQELLSGTATVNTFVTAGGSLYDITFVGWTGSLKYGGQSSWDETEILAGNVVWSACERYEITSVISYSPLTVRINSPSGYDLRGQMSFVTAEVADISGQYHGFPHFSDGSAGIPTPLALCIVNYYTEQAAAWQHEAENIAFVPGGLIAASTVQGAVEELSTEALRAVSKTAEMQGNGTSGSPLGLENGTATGNIWHWNGAGWAQNQIGEIFAPADWIDAQSLDLSDLKQSGATSGQVIKWNGSAWAPGTDATGGGGSTLEMIDGGAITADQDNFNPSGLSGAGGVSLSINAEWAGITGIVPQNPGKYNELTLYNRGDLTGVLLSENTNSTAANRFGLSTDVFLYPGGMVRLYYDAYASRWRLNTQTEGDEKKYTSFAGKNLFRGTSESSMDTWSLNSSGVSTSTNGGTPHGYRVFTIDLLNDRVAVHGVINLMVDTMKCAFYSRYKLRQSALSSGTENTALAVGLTSSNSTMAGLTRGAYFISAFSGFAVGDETITNTNWWCVLQASSSSATVYDTGIAPTTGSSGAGQPWDNVEVQYRRGEGKFFLNGTLVTTMTGETLTAANISMYPGLVFQKMVSTVNTAVALYLLSGEYKVLTHKLN